VPNGGYSRFATDRRIDAAAAGYDECSRKTADNVDPLMTKSRRLAMPNMIFGFACVAVIVLLAFSPYFIAQAALRMDKPKADPRPIQFSLQRLMLAIAVFAIGLSLVLSAVRGTAGIATPFAWLAGGTMIGASLFVPTREWIQGGCLGFGAVFLFGLIRMMAD
jgi:hypothetical protein